MTARDLSQAGELQGRLGKARPVAANAVGGIQGQIPALILDIRLS